MRIWIVAGAALVLSGAVAFFMLTTPERAAPDQVAGGEADPANGRIVFLAGGCASCHAIPGQGDRLLLGGGVKIESPAGTFIGPNISPDSEHGIGAWTQEQFATAVLKGTSPSGEHYFPAFPYTTYQHMKPEDVRDLFAFIKTLEPSDNVPSAHAFPLQLWPVRRGMGLWKALNFQSVPLAPVPTESAEWNRGRYLAEALGHCAECHSPRDIAGAIVAERRNGGGYLAGGAEAPNITPGKGGIGDWAEDDLVFFFEDGSTPEGDVVGGKMKDVIANTSELPEEDRRAMAIYLGTLPPVDN